MSTTIKPRLGGMRSLAALQQPTRTTDNYGATSIGWTTAAPVAARVEPLSGSEPRWAERVSPEVTHRVTIRWRADLSPGPDWRLVVGSRVFNITSVLDVEERHRFWELLCTEALGVTP